MTDWRLQGQQKYLKSKKLNFIEYGAVKDINDHDHCEFCGDKFSSKSDDLNSGYTTEDYYRWICEKCYQDFKVEFEWK